MQKIDALVRGDMAQRLDALQRDMEEGLANITEANLKLSQPYVASRSGNVELELAESGGAFVLHVYRGGTLCGSIPL